MQVDFPNGSTVVQWVSPAQSREIVLPIEYAADFEGMGGTLCGGKLRYDVDFIPLEKPRQNARKQTITPPAVPAWYALATQTSALPAWYK